MQVSGQQGWGFLRRMPWHVIVDGSRPRSRPTPPSASKCGRSSTATIGCVLGLLKLPQSLRFRLARCK
eukprot:11244726-Alexandrium_andersonii.AAC.1